MKIKSRKFVWISGSTIVLLAAVSFLEYSFSHAPSYSSYPYPTLDKQRSALANKKKITPTRILDSVMIIHDLKFLSSDSCEGRGPGSKGHALAMERILKRMREAGLDSFNNSLIQTFSGKEINGTTTGENIIGWIKGTTYPERYIVISAHYDHLGKTISGETYYGASDNASGTACILATAKYFKQHPHPYSLIFAAFDREEPGMIGSLSFMREATYSGLSLNIKFNLNVDMIARNDKNEIFACGIYHYPNFAYLVKETQSKTNVKLLMGHDTGNDHDDWTKESDHLAFHRKKIPFLYIGVEDHPDYHKTTDTYDKIDLSSYIENCNMVASIAQILKP